MMPGYVNRCLCVAVCSLDPQERRNRIKFVAAAFYEMGASCVEMSDEMVRMYHDDAYLAEWYSFLVQSMYY